MIIEDILEPELQENGRWSYNFWSMDVGDVMHCPILPNEKPQEAQTRVMSAAMSWHTKGGYDGWKFSSRHKNGVIQLKRVDVTHSSYES